MAGAKPKRWRVSIGWKSVKYYDVTAPTREEAEALAEKMCSDGDEPSDYWESNEHVEDVEPLRGER